MQQAVAEPPGTGVRQVEAHPVRVRLSLPVQQPRRSDVGQDEALFNAEKERGFHAMQGKALGLPA